MSVLCPTVLHSISTILKLSVGFHWYRSRIMFVGLRIFILISATLFIRVLSVLPALFNFLPEKRQRYVYTIRPTWLL